MPKKKPYFHNNVEAIRNAPDEAFCDPDMGLPFFDELMDWKCGGYQLPASVLCMIREHKPNGKIKEHIYQRRHAANKKIKQLLYAGHEFTLIDHTHCEHVNPCYIEYYDPLA